MRAPRPWICLMYHDVTAEPAPMSGGPAYFSVTAAGFARQLSIIESLNLRGCSIAEALAQPVDAVAISFDDGDLGQAIHAFPALVRHDMTATFFVTTTWIGRAKYASWDQLREMRAAGMAIQSHTHTHPFLSELDAPKLRDELRRSRETLDEQLDQRTNMIALPGGDAPAATLQGLLAEEGYDVVATSRWGRNRSGVGPPPHYVNRCTVRGDPDPASFTAIVTGDPWLTLTKQTRERVLAFVRASLGPSRYARWRRRFLNAGRGDVPTG
jgi:peptidoglycan/xylan/chitin deacetylase (PgdA/CDA1 family)